MLFRNVATILIQGISVLDIKVQAAEIHHMEVHGGQSSWHVNLH